MIPAVIYQIDFARLLLMWMPADLQLKSWMCWLKSLLYPLNNIYQDFLKFRKTKLYELSITPQVCYLQGMLNDRYDYTLRRIYITDAEEFLPLYLAMDAEADPLWLATDAETDPIWLPTDGETLLFADDFIIMVPVSLVFNNDEMKSLTSKYCLAGMKFKIQTF